MTKTQVADKQLRDRVWTSSKLFHPHKEIIREVWELEGVHKIVEYGAWTWADLIVFNEMWYDITYADYSDVALSKFQSQLDEKWITGIKVENSDALDIKFTDNQFDLVYHCGLIEHFEEEDRKKIMEWTIRITSKYLIVDFPNTLSGHTIVKKTMMAMGKRPYGWETNFTYREFKSRVEKNYWDILEYVWFYGRELFPFPRKMKEWMWRPDIDISLINYFKGSLWLIFKKK